MLITSAADTISLVMHRKSSIGEAAKWDEDVALTNADAPLDDQHDSSCLHE